VESVLRGARIVDGTGTEPTAGQVHVRDGRIVEVGPGAGRAVAGEGVVVVDLDGLWLLPGLIDAHSHLGIVSFSAQAAPAAVTAARIFGNCALALDAGFTTVRDTGGIDGGVAAAVAEGLVRGPRILPSGPLLCQTGGHGDGSDPFSVHPHRHVPGIPGLAQVSLPCDGPDEVRLATRTVLRRGATQVKVCVSGGVLSFTDRLEDAQFSVEELVAAVAEAEARDTYVTAHAHNVRGIRNGLAAGVSCFEHGTFLDEETARAMAAAGAFLVPTFTVARVMSEEHAAWGVPAEMLGRLAGVESAMARSLEIARAAGVVIGSGSDILGPRQTRRGMELAIRAELEDPMTAIVSATATNARVLRRAHELGTLEPGKLADAVAVDFDPLCEPWLFEDAARVRLVVKEGEVVKDTR
jgi:imidazolonepropionase-like amidohydrolase